MFFEDEDTMLCRKYSRDRDFFQVVFPGALPDVVLRVGHNSSLEGHPGQNNLHKRMYKVYYWNQMYARIMSTVREGTHGAKNQMNIMKKAHHLTLFPPGKPLVSVAIDILGNLPKSKGGSIFILVFADRFKKIIKIAPLHYMTSYALGIACNGH